MSSSANTGRTGQPSCPRSKSYVVEVEVLELLPRSCEMLSLPPSCGRSATFALSPAVSLPNVRRMYCCHFSNTGSMSAVVNPVGAFPSFSFWSCLERLRHTSMSLDKNSPLDHRVAVHGLSCTYDDHPQSKLKVHRLRNLLQCVIRMLLGHAMSVVGNPSQNSWERLTVS